MTAGKKSAPPARSAPVILIHGDDEYTVSEKAREVLDRLCPENQRDTALEVIDGQVQQVGEVAAVVNQVIQALRQTSLFGGVKVVWLQQASFFGTGGAGRAEGAKNAVKSLLAELKAGWLPAHHLLITTPGVDGRAAFGKQVKAAGDVFEFKKPDKAQASDDFARSMAHRFFEARGVKMAPGAMEQFIGMVGSDTRQLAQEAEKLSLYVGNRAKATEADVRAITAATRDAAGWDLADAVTSGNLVTAVEKVRQLLYQRESAVALVMGLSRRIRQLQFMRACLDQGWARYVAGGRDRVDWQLTEQAEQVLWAIEPDTRQNPVKWHPYRVLLLTRQARNFSADSLEHCRRLIVDTHERLITGSTSEGLMLELLITRIMGHRSRTPIK